MPSATRRTFLVRTALAAATVGALNAKSLRASQVPREDEPPHSVVLVTLDGLRPSEIFTGADEALLDRRAGVIDEDALRKRFWRGSAEARRAALLPFFWGTIAREGQILGNSDKGSVARVTNGKNFSYPGYNELLSGAADERIESNEKIPNPNMTVLGRINRRFAPGRVAAFGSWDVFPYIINREHSDVYINAGWEEIEGDNLSPRQLQLNELNGELPRHWEGVRYDALTFAAAMEYLRRESPRVLYIAFGETDDYAHEGRYDLYLDAAHRADAMIARLWTALQSSPVYRGRTSLLITTDHGRGQAPDGWKSHGADIPGADSIWIAGIGPFTRPLGERSDTQSITLSQVAATVAALLVGDDIRVEIGGEAMAPPIADLLPPRNL